MASATYTLIDSYTVGAGGASSVTLGSGGTIPQTYTDLLVLASLRDAGGNIGSNLAYTFNSNSSSYSGRTLFGTGTSTGSGTYAVNLFAAIPATNATANTFGNLAMYIPNYTSSNYKSLSTDSVTENNASTAYDWMDADLWSNTAAITSIQLSIYGGGTIAQYSTAYLYGIKNS